MASGRPSRCSEEIKTSAGQCREPALAKGLSRPKTPPLASTPASPTVSSSWPISLRCGGLNRVRHPRKRGDYLPTRPDASVIAHGCPSDPHQRPGREIPRSRRLAARRQKQLVAGDQGRACHRHFRTRPMELRGRRSRSTPFPWLDRRVNRLAPVLGHRPTTETLDERTAGPDASTNPPLHSWNAENNCQRYDLLAEQLLPASLKHGNPPLPRPARRINLRKSDALAMTCAFVWSPDRGSSRTCDQSRDSRVASDFVKINLIWPQGRSVFTAAGPLTCPDREKCLRPRGSATGPGHLCVVRGAARRGR
jgi:hypothetical protein